MERPSLVPGQSRVFVSILGALILIFAALTAMAGLPPAEQVPNFILGIAVLIAVTAGIGLVGWHLLVRPLPPNVQVMPQPLLSTRARNLIALYLTLGTVSIALAGVWDEIWHVKYGIPFGEDFLWRPHLMLYFGLSALVVTGGWSWWMLQTRGKGTLQQRFRANPLLGVTFLGGLFTIYAVGADPIWHRLYGADLTPWSLPHLLILVLIFVMSVLAITYHKSFMAQRAWRLALQATWRDVLLVLVLAGALLDFLLIFTIQWYGAAAGRTHQLQQVQSYPDWLLAVFITFLATLFGITALHATRQVGSATFVGVLTIGMRLGLDAFLGGVQDGTLPLWLILPILVGLDVWYAITLRRTQKPPAPWTTALVTALVFGGAALLLIPQLFPFVPLTATTISAMILASAITAVGGVWFGQVIGDLSPYGSTARATAPASGAPRWVSAAVYIAFVVFVVYFVVTATPPV